MRNVFKLILKELPTAVLVSVITAIWVCGKPDPLIIKSAAYLLVPLHVFACDALLEL